MIWYFIMWREALKEGRGLPVSYPGSNSKIVRTTVWLEIYIYAVAGFIPARKALPLLTLAGINPAATLIAGFSIFIYFIQMGPGHDTRLIKVSVATYKVR